MIPAGNGQRPVTVPPMADWDADVIVVGSGFGGAVSALRLTEAGHRVLVLEKGRRHSDADLLRARRDPRAYLWQPGLGMRGFFHQRIFRHLAVIGGAGVGGGSIVWAGVLLDPPAEFYRAETLQHLGVDWESELAPYLRRAGSMLGRATCPHVDVMDQHLAETARSMGAGSTFGPVPVAIHFGRPGEREADPFFGGEGPERTGCRLCGECLLGCPYGAKNQLTRNYLYLAEKYGAQVQPEHEVISIAPDPNGGYRVHNRHRWRRGRGQELRARQVVLSGGVLDPRTALPVSRRTRNAADHLKTTRPARAYQQRSDYRDLGSARRRPVPRPHNLQRLSPRSRHSRHPEPLSGRLAHARPGWAVSRWCPPG